MNEYSEDFRFDNGIVYVYLAGTFPKTLLLEEKNLFQPLIDECSSHQCHKAIIDATKLKVDFDTTELYRAGKDATHLSRLNLRVAIVAREDMVDLFFEDVAFNRGGDIQVFTTLAAARKWLKKSY